MARIAKSLDVLRTQINRKCPSRKKDYDGWIGDTAHSQRKSDHNPDRLGIVKALDITNDPRNGVDCNQLSKILVANGDPRWTYLIWNGQIYNRDVANRWRPYTGANKHDHHIHISVGPNYDSTEQWDLSPWDVAPEPSEQDAPQSDEVVAEVKDTSFASLVPGGYYSADPYNTAVNTSIRCNNPGALNTVEWVTKQPGFIGAYETTKGNKTAIFRTPEHGVSAWWTLLKRYRESDAVTVDEIIKRYGGGQDYSEYAVFVRKRSGLAGDESIELDNDDELMKLAKAMFRYEAGRDLPWSDAQILYGINLAQGTLTPGVAEKPKSKMKTLWGLAGLGSTATGSATYAMFEKLDNPFVFTAFCIILVLILGFGYLIYKGRLDIQKIVRQLSGEE